MESYVSFTRNIVQAKQPEDILTLEEIKYDQLSHPRAVMTIRRSNGLPYPFLVKTIVQLIERGNGQDPVTRQPFSDLTKQRAFLYNDCLRAFPNYQLNKMNAHNLYQRWVSTYQQDMDSKERDKVRLEAKCFLQAEDLMGIFNSFHGKGSMLNRVSAEAALENGQTWILRDSSVKDTEYDHAYTLTKRVGTQIEHFLIIHRIGDGFYFGAKGIMRGKSATDMAGWFSSYPTIIHLLEANVQLSFD